MMSSMLSSTDWMKQALPCGYSYCVGSAARLAELTVVEVIPFTTALADAVLVMQPDIEPHWRVERAVLVQAEPRQVIVENLGAFRVRKIAVGDAAVGDRPASRDE
jgi:hypothetical protein